MCPLQAGLEARALRAHHGRPVSQMIALHKVPLRGATPLPGGRFSIRKTHLADLSLLRFAQKGWCFSSGSSSNLRAARPLHFTLVGKSPIAPTVLHPLASTSDLIAGRALDANGRYVNDVLDDPDLMAPVQLEPVGRLGGVFVFGDYHQLAGLFDVVSDLLCAAEARPLPQELHFHKNQYRVGSDFNHGVAPFLPNRRPPRKSGGEEILRIRLPGQGS